MRSATFWFTALSSASRMRSGRRSARRGCPAAAGGAGATIGAGISSTSTTAWNVDPRPTSLSTHIVPPMSSARWMLIGKPETGAAVLPGSRCIALAEGLEQATHAVGGDADAGVVHGDVDAAGRSGAALGVDADAAPCPPA